MSLTDSVVTHVLPSKVEELYQVHIFFAYNWLYVDILVPYVTRAFDM